MERVWHALRACVVNSNGTTDPQRDLWADSPHPPLRPSVQLGIGKQAWCMQSTRCTEDMWLTHPGKKHIISAITTTNICYIIWIVYGLILQNVMLCFANDNV